jgi:hypothetical protein
MKNISSRSVGVRRAACGFSKYTNRRDDKSAKRLLRGLLSLLASCHLRVSGKLYDHTPNRGETTIEE